MASSPATEPTSHAASPRVREEPVVLLVGNPNVGKTSLFNALTGQSARVGNYPGVTIERRDGVLRRGSGGHALRIVDVPGAYSLSARSVEEQIALEAVLGIEGNPAPSLVVVVVDAGQLARNLYLALQLSELHVPLLVALNMVDEVEGPAPSASRLSELLGAPVVQTNGRTAAGADQLADAIARAVEDPPHSTLCAEYPDELSADAEAIAKALPSDWTGDDSQRAAALGLWALASIDDDDELRHIPTTLREQVGARRQLAAGRDLDREMIEARYTRLDTLIADLAPKHVEHPPKRKMSERIDRVLLHPFGGFVAFILVMLVVFQALFSWSDPLIGVVEDAVVWVQALAEKSLPEGVFRDLVVEGIIGGVGNVIVFLPQILLLFFFLALLEDSGYMARVAYLMDRIMKAVGLNGRAFIPMLGGFACAVPAIMATRTMERERDRLLTMLVIPLTTCSARLPVYTLVIAALFPPNDVWGFLPVQGLLMVGMYLFGLVMTLVAAAIIGRTTVKGRRIPLLMELPPYRRPKLSIVLRVMRERSWLFLREAGTVIAAFTIILWALLSFPKPPEPAPGTPPEVAQAQALEHSVGGRIGKAIEPAIEPLGFDWKIGVGLIGAFAAREVFVSTMALVYGIGEVDEDDPAPLRERMRQEQKDNGQPIYTPLTGLSLMVFFALACQCMSTVAVVRRETRSWKWPAFLVGYMTGLAYLASLLVYQGGKLLGFS